jgi:hypothetical protein
MGDTDVTYCSNCGAIGHLAGQCNVVLTEPPIVEPRVSVDLRDPELVVLSDRVDALEQIVDELLAGKRKRSEYMREYMRKRRARS